MEEFCSHASRSSSGTEIAGHDAAAPPWRECGWNARRQSLDDSPHSPAEGHGVEAGAQWKHRGQTRLEPSQGGELDGTGID